MSFKEIKELRQSGNLEEALQMANEALSLDPTDIWNKRAAAWVHYDYLKKYVQSNLFNEFKQHLSAIQDLQLPEDEKMVFDNCAWQIGSVVYALQRSEQVDYGKINDLYQIIRNFHFTKPSEAYSFIYKAFLKGNSKWRSYIEFADWWGFDNFRNEDYLEEEFNGRPQMSVVEKSYIAYAKRLLSTEQADELGFISINVKPEGAKISEFIPHLDLIVEAHPEYQFLPYFKAKLMLEVGSQDNVIDTLLPFAKKKKNDYWIWQLMAEILSNDKVAQLACYCKALSLKTSDEFLVKLRQTFASILIDLNLYNEAKAEIERVIETRNKEGWNTPNQLINWTKQPWYATAISTGDNKRFYAKHIDKAEQILHQNVPEETIVVEFVNIEKKILNFVKDKMKYGAFKYAGLLDKPQIGDFLVVRFNDDGQDGFFKVLTAKKVESQTTEAIKSFEGMLKIIPSLNIGFVTDVFITPKIIDERKLAAGQRLKGKAILSFNKKKNEWGWKAIEVKSH